MLSWDKIEFGFDIATSISIIGAVFIFWRSQVKEAQAIRAAGVDDKVKGVSINMIIDILKECENSYVSVASNASIIKNKLGRFSDRDKDIETFSRRLLESNSLREESVDSMEALRLAAHDFMKLTRVRRYTIISLIATLDKGDEYVKFLTEIFDSITASHNRIVDYKHLCSRLILLQEMVNEKFKDFPSDLYDGVDETSIVDQDKYVEFKSLRESFIISKDSEWSAILKSLIYDSDNLSFFKSFVPTEDEKDLDRLADQSISEISDSERAVLLKLMITFYEIMRTKPYRVVTIAFRHYAADTNDLLRSCKSVLISLSSLIYILQSRSNSLQLKDVYEHISSPKYLDRDTGSY